MLTGRWKEKPTLAEQFLIIRQTLAGVTLSAGGKEVAREQLKTRPFFGSRPDLDGLGKPSWVSWFPKQLPPSPLIMSWLQRVPLRGGGRAEMRQIRKGSVLTGKEVHPMASWLETLCMPQALSPELPELCPH